MHGRVYAWATPNYILGSSQEVPDRWRMHVAGAIRATLILRGDPRKAVYTEFERERPPTIFQHRNVQISSGGEGREWFPFPLLEEVVEEEGWLFGRDENAYFGFRVASGDWKWQEAESLEDEADRGDYVMYDPDSPAILEVAEAEDYGGDFERFRRDLLDNMVEWDGKTLVYETGSGAESGPGTEAAWIRFASGEEALVSADGEHYESTGIADYPRFGSSYLRSDYASGVVTIEYGGERLEYRFPKEGTASVTAR
jgi:hypothetical protein